MDTNELVRAIHEATAVGGTLIDQVPDLPERDPLSTEWRTFKREVYRLMCSGGKGRFALIKGDHILSTWDTASDARQAGRERFGSEAFLVQEIQLYVKPVRSGYLRRCVSN